VLFVAASVIPSVEIGGGISMHKRTLIALILLIFTAAGRTLAQSPAITNISPNSGAVGSSVAITGTNFGSAQGNSTITLNGTTALVANWSNTTIVAVIPANATSGLFAVTVNGQTANSSSFSVTSLPSGWSDSDIGTVGISGSASYSNGKFTVNGAGVFFSGTTVDALNFVYQSLSGDGTIVARVVNRQGTSATKAGVMIRESLNPNSKSAYVDLGSSLTPYEDYRTTTGGSSSSASIFGSLYMPYYVKLARVGTSFTGSISSDSINWVQVTSVSITMTQNVYVGLAVTSDSTTSAATATFDGVSISSSAMSAPTIANISATNAAAGTQIGIGGSNFGASEGNGIVTINGVPMTISSWSTSGIVFTIPNGASSGWLFVSTGPSMNASSTLYFTVTSQPLPIEWLDQDVGQAPTIGSASFSNGTFTVSGSGLLFSGQSADGFHFAYQTLSGDGSIVARVVSLTGADGSTTAGVMIRESLTAGSTHASTVMDRAPNLYLLGRLTNGGTNGKYGTLQAVVSFPYWVKLVRSGNTFSSYLSADGVNWTQGTSPTQTISMAQKVYIGLAVSGGQQSTVATATFDNVSINTGSDPSPVITSLSATTGPIGTQVTITGSNFGASQGGSVAMLNGSPLATNFWSATSIVATIPTGVTSGLLVVSFGPDSNESNAVHFTVTSQPLPVGWLDSDIGLVGTGGSATYANGTFTVNGTGVFLNASTGDGLHLAYQPLSGDGSIVARIVSEQASSGNATAGAIIRESLLAGSTYVSTTSNRVGSTYLQYRASSGGNSASTLLGSATFPYWIKAVRSGSTLSGYRSTDGVNWTQVGTSQTISMAQNVYVGLAVGSGSTTSSATATFDNVSVTVGTTPYISGLAPSLGGVGTTVTIAGSNFGATQGTSTITFNGAAATVTSWSNSQIVATVPAAVLSGTGPVSVTVNSIASVPVQSFTAIKPVISGLAPPAAPIGGTITLSGSGFGTSSSGSQVLFNGIAATVTAWSDTSITATVPANTTSGSVSVNEAGFASNTASFTVIEGLSVGGLSPAIGSVGTTVTITGAGFGATQSNSVASFYGSVANVVSWSDTAIVATVQVGTSSGNVTVTVAGTTAQGPPFFLTSGLTLTDSLGNTTTYNAQVVSGIWQVTDSQGSGCSSCTQRGTIHKTYDGQGNVLTQTDELSRTTTNTYDLNGNVLSISQPDGNGNTVTTSYTYNSFNEVLTTTDPLGNVTGTRPHTGHS